MRSRLSAIRTMLAAAAAFLAACDDQPLPTGPQAEADPVAPGDVAPQVGPTGPSVFSDRAHALVGDAFELLSEPGEIEAGRYRFRTATGEYPAVVRDDFVVVETEDGEVEVRRVVERRTEGDVLVLETGPAYWHEIVNGGTYQITVPFNGTDEASLLPPGPLAAPIPLESQGLQLPAIERGFDDVDVCAWLDSLVAEQEGSEEGGVCGEEKDLTFTKASTTIAVAGRLDSPRFLSGRVRISGEVDVHLTVDPGGISGGRVPRFTPCDRAFYLGCIGTPLGAALIEFLRRYAPQIPEGMLPPSSICIPGTWIRVQRGYWSGFKWNPPVWQRCVVADAGQLPTVTLPSVQAAGVAVRPRLQGEISARAKGDGSFMLKFPAPNAGVAGTYGTENLSVKVSLGMFGLVKGTLKNSGATVLFTFDDTGLATQGWDPTNGWQSGFEILEKSHSAQFLDVHAPDSIVFRVGTPLEARVSLCIAVVGCPTGPDSTATK